MKWVVREEIKRTVKKRNRMSEIVVNRTGRNSENNKTENATAKEE
jgi:hypothetical protein